MKRIRQTTLLATVVVAVATTATAAHAQSPYFPRTSGRWATSKPESLGWNRGALDELFDYARREKSTALLIIENGRIVAERYWQRGDVPRVGSTPEGWPIEDVYSLQKSFISLLVGIATDRGLLDRRAPVSKYIGVGWSRASRDGERQITINHLLSMTSGLNDSLEPVAPAGSRWYYNTAAYSQLIRVLAAVAHKDVNKYSAEWLTSAIGMSQTRWVMRQAPGPNPYGLATTARDMARVGLLVLRNGSWLGKQVVSRAYIREAVAPSQALNPTYGLLWWMVNRQVLGGDQDSTGDFYVVPSAPRDMVAALGAGDRKIYVVPSRNLVIVRFGAEVDGAEGRFDREFWERLSKVIP